MFWSGGYTNLLNKFSQIDESIDKIEKSLGGENNEYQKGEGQDFVEERTRNFVKEQGKIDQKEKLIQPRWLIFKPYKKRSAAKTQLHAILQLQWFTKYLRLTLIFMWNNALREKFDFYFSRVFCWS